MNLLYCGDAHIEDGLIISVLSILRQIREEVNVTVLTMSYQDGERTFLPVPESTVRFLDEYVREKSPDSRVCLLDCTDLFATCIPDANLETRFTPYCMLRLFADEIDGLPDRILYLDTDVVCRRDFSDFYHQDMEGYELAGIPDYYGSWFFHRWRLEGRPVFFDYLNSGVMLLNMAQIRRSSLFARCRQMCRDEQMFMPDQTALNKLCDHKKICRRRYNEQRRLHDDTVIQHFTTHFRFFPRFCTECVKPWEIDRMHETLKLHEYDGLLEEYRDARAALDGRRAAQGE